MAEITKAPRRIPLSRVIESVTNALEPEVATEFLKAIRSAYRDSGLSAVVRRIERGEIAIWSGDAQAALQTAAQQLTINTAGIEQALQQAFTRAGQQSLAAVTSQPFTFNYISPQAVAWSRTHAAELVQATKQVRAVVRETITRAIESGTPPYALANRLEQVIGLTRRQAMAVHTYQRGLIKAGRNEKEAANLAKQYAERLLEARAKTIARTEVAKAVQAGRREAMYQARAAGLLTSDARLQWITAAREMACDVCRPLNGKLVPLDGRFRTGVGSIEGPPAHPNCRCDVAIISGVVVKESEVDKAAKPRKAQERYPKGDPRGGQFKPKGGATAGKSGGAATKVQLRRIEKQIAKRIAPGATVDLTGLSVASAKVVAASVKQFADEFPAAARSINEVTTRTRQAKEDFASVKVQYRNVPGSRIPDQKIQLRINPRTMATPERAQRILSHPSQAGWHPYNNLKGVMDHEMGHVLSFYASPPYRGSGIKQFGFAGWPPVTRAFRSRIRSRRGRERFGDYPSNTDSPTEEAFAELFAMRQSGEWNFNNEERSFMAAVINPGRRVRKSAPESTPIGGYYDSDIPALDEENFIKPMDSEEFDALLNDELWEKAEKEADAAIYGEEFTTFGRIRLRIAELIKAAARRSSQPRHPAGTPGGLGGRFKPSDSSAGGAAGGKRPGKRPGRRPSREQSEDPTDRPRLTWEQTRRSRRQDQDDSPLVRAELPKAIKPDNPNATVQIEDLDVGDGRRMRVTTVRSNGLMVTSRRDITEYENDTTGTWRDRTRLSTQGDVDSYTERTIRSAFEGTFGGYQTTVDTIEAEEYGGGLAIIKVEGLVRLQSGRVIGSFSRSINLTNGVVNHQLLQLSTEFRGSKFATEFNRSAEAMYKENGMQSIRLHANIDVGGYAWARQGYQWEDARDTGDVRAKIGGVLDGYSPTPISQDTQTLLRRTRDALDDAADGIGRGNVPTPFDVSQIGKGTDEWTDPRTGVRMWPGKAVMLGSNWYGVKSLTDE